MDKHDVAHYAVGAIALALGATAMVAPHKPAPPIEVSTSLAGKLKTVTPHAVAIYCVPSMCDAADQMADQFELAGWKGVSVATAIDANAGVGVRGSADLCRFVSEAVSDATKCDPVSDSANWEIWIGRAERHK
jgi:hypothetical protein